MKKYIFGKGIVAISTNNNSLKISKLGFQGTLGEAVENKEEIDTIILKFTSLSSVENVIQKLQEVRNTMAKKLLEAL